MPALQKRGLTSSTSHIIQKCWASPLSKGGTVDSNGYREIVSVLDTQKGSDTKYVSYPKAIPIYSH